MDPEGCGKNKLSQDGAEYSIVFEARVAMHIEIFIATRNKEDELRDKQDGIIYFFRSPNITPTLLEAGKHRIVAGGYG
jgi:hypothetical protein